MKTTLRRSIAASRNGPSEKRAGAPRNGSATAFERCECAGQAAVGEQAGDAAVVEPAAQREHRVDAAERDRVQLGAAARAPASVSLIRRALSSYMIIATRRPLLVADHAQRLEAAEVGAEGEHALAARERLEDRLDAARLEARTASKRSCSR